MTARSSGRVRKTFDLQEVVDLAEFPASIAEEEAQLARLLAKAPRSERRPLRNRLKRHRRRNRQNYRPGILELVIDLLRWPEFFELAERLEVPDGCFGPTRRYSVVSVFLWECLLEEFSSFRRMEAFFGDEIVWRVVSATLEEAWPDDPTRRVGQAPMTRSQFHRHRRMLRELYPEAVVAALDTYKDVARRQALAMGYFQPGAGSLANPDLRNVVKGDGTFIKARFDAILGDKVEDPVTGVPQQARFDPDADMGLDDRGDHNPGYRFVHFSVQQPEHEQEGVILSFGRVGEGGEPRVARSLLRELKSALPDLRHYVYDMAPQGAVVDELSTLR